MPVLTQQNPRFLHNIAALTPLLREEDQLLQELSTAQLPPVETGVDWLSLSGEKLLAMPRPLALRGIGQLAQRLIPNLVLELRHRQDILSLCAPTASPSAQISLPQGLIVRREYHLLVFTTAAPGTVQEVLFPLPGEIQVGCYHISAVPAICDGQHTPWDFWLSGQLDAVTLRKRQQGDRLQRPNRPEKTLKSLMIDEKISRHLRDSLPVFCRDQEIFAVAGLGVSQHALPPLGSHGWHIRISPAQDHIQSPIADSI